jgi:hypothetical protein
VRCEVGILNRIRSNGSGVGRSCGRVLHQQLAGLGPSESLSNGLGLDGLGAGVRFGLGIRDRLNGFGCCLDSFNFDSFYFDSFYFDSFCLDSTCLDAVHSIGFDNIDTNRIGTNRFRPGFSCNVSVDNSASVDIHMGVTVNLSYRLGLDLDRRSVRHLDRLTLRPGCERPVSGDVEELAVGVHHHSG